MSEMRALMEYFAQFDGEKKWDEIVPYADRVHHPDLIVSTGTGELRRDEFRKAVEDSVRRGISFEVLQMEKSPTGIRYELLFHNVDGTNERTAVVGTYKDGMLYRVYPDNLDVFSHALQ